MKHTLFSLTEFTNDYLKRSDVSNKMIHFVNETTKFREAE